MGVYIRMSESQNVRMSECQNVRMSECYNARILKLDLTSDIFLQELVPAPMLIVKNVKVFKQFAVPLRHLNFGHFEGACTFYTTTPSMAVTIIPLSLSLPWNHSIVIQTIIQTHWCQLLHQNTFKETLICESTVSHMLPWSLALSSSMFWYWAIANT